MRKKYIVISGFILIGIGSILWGINLMTTFVDTNVSDKNLEIYKDFSGFLDIAKTEEGNEMVYKVSFDTKNHYDVRQVKITLKNQKGDILDQYETDVNKTYTNGSVDEYRFKTKLTSIYDVAETIIEYVF